MDAKVLLKSQLKFRVPIEHYHWVAALNYCIHLQHRNIETNLGLSTLQNFLSPNNRKLQYRVIKENVR